jgi:hypothetical protein
MRHRTLALSALLTVLAVAACGGAATSPSPLPSASAAPSTAVVTSPAPSAPASAAPGPSSSSAAGSPAASGGVPHGAPELEGNLPRAFRGQPLFLLSFGPTELSASPAGESFKAIVTAAAGDLAKSGFAVANDSAPSRDATFNTFAVSGGGADGTKLVTAYVASAIAGGASLSSSSATLGGRAVTRIKSPDANPLGDAWVYAIDDVMYGVQTKDEALAAELITLLP